MTPSVGVLADRIDRTVLLFVGTVLLANADIVLATVPGQAGLAVGIVLWGLHMGFTQGVVAALIANAAPAQLRGTAFGIFSLVTGIGLLAACVIRSLIGWRWSRRDFCVRRAARAYIRLFASWEVVLKWITTEIDAHQFVVVGKHSLQTLNLMKARRARDATPAKRSLGSVRNT